MEEIQYSIWVFVSSNLKAVIFTEQCKKNVELSFAPTAPCSCGFLVVLRSYLWYISGHAELSLLHNYTLLWLWIICFCF